MQMEELFKDFILQLKIKEDGLVYFRDNRSVLLSVPWFTTMQRELEGIIGADGAFVLIESAAKRWASRAVNDYAPLVKGKPFEEKIKFVLQMHSITGWGNWELAEFSSNPLQIIIKETRPYHEDAYGGKADGPRCYYQSGLVALIEELAKLEGLPPTKGTETKCMAQGDPYCEFVFSSAPE